jgi:hypothetical protein
MANSRFGLRTRPGLVRSYAEGVGATDADATAFLNAAGITDATTTAAIQQLVIDLKFYSIWTKCKAIYPFVGASASAHKFNLKDAQDTDGAFRLVFSGGITHSSTGALFNGTTGYADSKFVPNSNSLSYNNNHIALYSRTSAAGGVTSFYDMGAGDDNSGTGNMTLWARRSANTSAYDTGDGNLNRVLFSNSDGQGFYLGKADSTTGKIYKNGVQQATKSLTNLTLTSRAIYLGAYNENNSVQYYTQREFAFASIGEGLTDTQAANLYTAVQAFQTTLGRQV